MIDINAERYGHVTIMNFHGVLTRQELKDLDDAWNEEVSHSPEVIALNFRDITQIDSICINHLFKMVRTAEEKGFKLVIYDIFESLKKIFEVIKLDKVIPVMTRQKFESTYMKDV